MNVLKRNNVKVSGQGKRVLLFAHGFGCDQQMWRYITPAFEEDFKIVLFDYVGCGNSDLENYDANRYASLHGYALDIVEICEALDLKEVTLVGHSVSAMIGILAANQEPNYFKSLILVCPSACYLNKNGYTGGFEKKDLEELMAVMDSNYLGWSNYLAPIVMKNADRPELTEELEKSFCSMDKEITRNFARTTFFSDNRKDLKQVQHPCLVLQCADDDIACEQVGEYVHSQLSDSTIIYMKATGHCPHMSHPEETISCIREYLYPVPTTT